MHNVGADGINLLSGFSTFDARISKEREIRVKNGRDSTSFGVAFLDDALSGIYPNDLIVVGAKTGLGKSQLGTIMALANARAGKRVHFLALEAEEYEIERRIKYQLIAEKFFKLPVRPAIRLNYMDWYYGKFDQELNALENDVESEMPMFPSLNVYYRESLFDAKEFERIFLAIKNDTDLVIIDHLHYFDFDDENENRAVKQVVKKIRDCALIAAKPVVLIAHIRKSDRRLKQLLPEIEDFHGSSDIGKIATKAIVIAPSKDASSPVHRTTFFSVLKCRVDGSRMRAVASLAFNMHNQKYEDSYYTGSLNSDGSEFVPDSIGDVPFWARRASNKGSIGRL